MNTKKVGLVTAGVVTALLAASPLAFATEGHGPGPVGKACSFNGGDAGASSEISGASGYNYVYQLVQGGNNEYNQGNCSEFGNNNDNGNLSGNYVGPAPTE